MVESGIFLVADELRSARTAAGWSAGDLARHAVEVAAEVGEELSLTQQAISQFENKRLKKSPFWLKYAQAALELRRVHTADRQRFLEGWFGRFSPSILPPPPKELDHNPTWLSLRVPLPSEAALAAMFEAQLVVFRDLSGADLARALARRLPSGLSRLQEAQLFEDLASPTVAPQGDGHPEPDPSEAQPAQHIGHRT